MALTIFDFFVVNSSVLIFPFSSIIISIIISLSLSTVGHRPPQMSAIVPCSQFDTPPGRRASYTTFAESFEFSLWDTYVLIIYAISYSVVLSILDCVEGQ